MDKDKAIDAIKAFPQEFELEELIEKLILVEKVEKGLAQVSEQKTVPHENIKDIIKKW